jgi:hypothetical protein
MSKLQIEEIQKIPIHYIIALPRTGSTLLVKMLNQNPHILSTIEEPFKYNLYPKYASVTDWNDETIEEFCYDFFLFSNHKLSIQSVTRDNLVSLLKEHQENLNFRLAVRLAYLTFFPKKEKSTIKCIVDKQLKYYTFIKETHARNPYSKFIILYREPVDNIYRWHIMRKKRGNTYDIKTLSKLWVNRYKGILTQVNEIPAENVHFVKYCDLIKHPEAELRKIHGFLSVEMDESILNSEYERSAFETNNPTWKEKHAKELSFHTMLFKKPDISKIGEGYRELDASDINLIKEMTQEMFETLEKTKNGKSAVIPFFTNKEKLITLTWRRLPFSAKKLIKKLKYDKFVRNKYYQER